MKINLKFLKWSITLKKAKNSGVQKASATIFCLILTFYTSLCFAQSTPQPKPSFTIGVKGGYDFPLFSTNYKELSYDGNRNIGATLDYRFPSNIGIRLDYANIVTNPKIHIPSMVNFGAISTPTIATKNNIKRNFVGIGPSYYLKLKRARISFLFSPMVGYGWISGGDALVEAQNPSQQNITDFLLMNTGFEDGAISAKFDWDIDFNISKNFSLGIGFYYLRHFGVNLDNSLDINNIGNISIAHGENVFDNSLGPYTISSLPPNVVRLNVEKQSCIDLASIGATIGLKYTFGEREAKCNTCGCPNDKHKVVVTVRDEPSQKVIPGADVAIKDMSGNIVATGTTNSFGVVDFGEIPHGNYTITGLLYDIETTTAALVDSEFQPNVVIQKEILYDDLRFILKGKVINRNSKSPEPNVVVSLTNDQTGAVKQDNSDGKGEFIFRLDKNSSYEVVGIKENRLSEIERTSTIGLTRSTTLFVDLELGVENFDCNQGTVLDIKYNLDKADLLPESKFDLDRLVRYMKDHQVSRVELSSHTDCRGSDDYNKDLSERRATSAVEYIISKGITRNRIIAQGYGETRLLNRCSDGVNCSEEEHRINRRTEAKLLCK